VIHTYCQYIDCKNNSAIDNIKFDRLPIMPTLCEKSSQKNKGIMYHAIRIFFRKVCYERCGLSTDDPRKNIRICNKHDIELIEPDVEFLDTKNKTRIAKPKMYVPMKPIIENNINENRRLSRGLGKERRLNNTVQSIIQSANISQHCSEATIIMLSQILEKANGDVANIDVDLITSVCNKHKKK
jgi:hypothetical protein